MLSRTVLADAVALHKQGSWFVRRQCRPADIIHAIASRLRLPPSAIACHLRSRAACGLSAIRATCDCEPRCDHEPWLIASCAIGCSPALGAAWSHHWRRHGLGSRRLAHLCSHFSISLPYRHSSRMKLLQKHRMTRSLVMYSLFSLLYL
jgi:hypothetical protein